MTTMWFLLVLTIAAANAAKIDSCGGPLPLTCTITVPSGVNHVDDMTITLNNVGDSPGTVSRITVSYADTVVFEDAGEHELYETPYTTSEMKSNYLGTQNGNWTLRVEGDTGVTVGSVDYTYADTACATGMWPGVCTPDSGRDFTCTFNDADTDTNRVLALRVRAVFEGLTKFAGAGLLTRLGSGPNPNNVEIGAPDALFYAPWREDNVFDSNMREVDDKWSSTLVVNTTTFRILLKSDYPENATISSVTFWATVGNDSCTDLEPANVDNSKSDLFNISQHDLNHVLDHDNTLDWTDSSDLIHFEHIDSGVVDAVRVQFEYQSGGKIPYIEVRWSGETHTYGTGQLHVRSNGSGDLYTAVSIWIDLPRMPVDTPLIINVKQYGDSRTDITLIGELILLVRTARAPLTECETHDILLENCNPATLPDGTLRCSMFASVEPALVQSASVSGFLNTVGGVMHDLHTVTMDTPLGAYELASVGHDDADRGLNVSSFASSELLVPHGTRASWGVWAAVFASDANMTLLNATLHLEVCPCLSVELVEAPVECAGSCTLPLDTHEIPVSGIRAAELVYTPADPTAWVVGPGDTGIEFDNGLGSSGMPDIGFHQSTIEHVNATWALEANIWHSLTGGVVTNGGDGFDGDVVIDAAASRLDSLVVDIGSNCPAVPERQARLVTVETTVNVTAACGTTTGREVVCDLTEDTTDTLFELGFSRVSYEYDIDTPSGRSHGPVWSSGDVRFVGDVTAVVGGVNRTAFLLARQGNAHTPGTWTVRFSVPEETAGANDTLTLRSLVLETVYYNETRPTLIPHVNRTRVHEVAPSANCLDAEVDGTLRCSFHVSADAVHEWTLSYTVHPLDKHSWGSDVHITSIVLGSGHVLEDDFAIGSSGHHVENVTRAWTPVARAERANASGTWHVTFEEARDSRVRVDNLRLHVNATGFRVAAPDGDDDGDDDDDDDALGAGAIVGIVLGSVAGAVLVVMAVFYREAIASWFSGSSAGYRMVPA